MFDPENLIKPKNLHPLVFVFSSDKMITEYTLEIALEKFLFPKQVARNSALSGEPGILERRQRCLFSFRVKRNLQM